MPGKPLKPCFYPGCSVLVADGTTRCDKHKEKAWTRRPGVETKRRTGAWLTKQRKKLFMKQPLCVICLAMKPSRVTLATIRDHIVPLEEGGADDETNTQPVCKPCHDIKSQEEAKRGMGGRRKR